MSGTGAEEVARRLIAAGDKHIEIVEPDYFWTPRTRAHWQRYRALLPDRGPLKGQPGANQDRGSDVIHGTVGCVVLDTHGNLAAGTSTGGLSGKLPGRIGDSPLIAAGTYADNRTCAVSCSGRGEEFIRRAIAFDVSAAMRHRRMTLSEAAREVLKQLPKGCGGVIAVDRKGNLVAEFNTLGFFRAAADSSGRSEVRIWDDVESPDNAGLERGKP
jgi:beta-aspartyl-peptidase (threonine type)